MNWFMTALKSYAVFSGRSRRSEYWYFALCYLILYAVCAIVDGLTGSFDRASGIGLFTGVLTLALLIPSLSVGVRRLHDTGRSGWWLLIAFVPLVGLAIVPLQAAAWLVRGFVFEYLALTALGAYLTQYRYYLHGLAAVRAHDTASEISGQRLA